jgi:isopentenyl phosphate kinase
MLLLLKLGGSLITDKLKVAHARLAVLERLAGEIGRARASMPQTSMVLGHGSGSFGHVVAARYGTSQGARTVEEWHGFAEVSAAASRLNRIVLDAFLSSGLPAISLQPSASAQCDDGKLVRLSLQPLHAALDAGLMPVVYGDVAFDRTRGATIISTEMIMSYLAAELRPDWILLAGEAPGVIDASGSVIPLITRQNIATVQPALSGSHGTDVTGGMLGKVLAMLELAAELPETKTLIFSGVRPGALENALIEPSSVGGTVIRNSSPDQRKAPLSQ